MLCMKKQAYYGLGVKDLVSAKLVDSGKPFRNVSTYEPT
jgi:hypothetical protein